MNKFILLLRKHKEIELEEIKKERNKGIPVRLNPDSLYAKEIEYQTVLLKQIIENQNEILRILKD